MRITLSNLLSKNIRVVDNNLQILHLPTLKGCSAAPAISGHRIGQATSGKALHLFWPGSSGLKLQSADLKQLQSAAVRTCRNPHARIPAADEGVAPLLPHLPQTPPPSLY